MSFVIKLKGLRNIKKEKQLRDILKKLKILHHLKKDLVVEI